MARNSKVRTKKKPGRNPASAEGKGRVRRGRPKVCQFCTEHAQWVDYKDVSVLRRFMNDRGRIKARGATGTCVQHQRDVAAAIKTARELVLLPYVVRALAPDPRDRRGGPRQSRPPQPAAVDEATETAAAPDADDPSEETDALAVL